MTKQKKKTLTVHGMHCQSCDVLVADKFKTVDGVTGVQADYRTCSVNLTYTGNLNTAALEQSIHEYGYSLKPLHNSPSVQLSTQILEAAILAMIIGFVYFFAWELKLIPSFSGSSTLTWGTAFILGLIASASTCMATSGALFLATVGKVKEKAYPLIPALSFNAGRVLSYTFFGFILGHIGNAVYAIPTAGPFLTLFVAFAMVLVGMDMLKIVSVTAFVPQSFTKGIFASVEHRLLRNPRQTAFALGAITYLLPCGFTQSVQLFALGLGNPVQSALLMGAFAVGTTPALFALGYAGTFTKAPWYPMFGKVLGVIVFLIGASYFINAMTLYGVTSKLSVLFPQPAVQESVPADPNVTLKDGVQVVRMSVTERGYKPNSFTVKQGIPVRWVVEGKQVFGCQGALIAPQANINTPVILKAGENVLEFTPKQKGPLSFSCAMGMFTGQFNVI
jgi:sulfite exporter TauE/SafE/copper chaperone CopZ